MNELLQKMRAAIGALALRLVTTDRAIVAGGIALAGFAAFFPWYVFLHQDSFGVRPMQSMADGEEVRNWPSTGLYAESPLAIVREAMAMPAPLDPLSTGTVPGVMAPLSAADGKTDRYRQALPNPRPFALIHVANGRALIENGGGMYIVRVGSTLPDNSRLARLEQRGEDWVIVTTRGDVIGH